MKSLTISRGAFLLLVACSASAKLQAADTERLFPAASWQTKPPSEVGLKAEQLNEFAKSVGGDGVIIRDGFLVKSWGRPDACGDWASAAKPVLSTLLLLAVEDRRLPSVDAPVNDAGFRPKDASMTYRRRRCSYLAGAAGGRLSGQWHVES